LNGYTVPMPSCSPFGSKPFST